ncbi:MAG: diadenylate cyclase CdaA [Bacteroidales bacterium]
MILQFITIRLLDILDIFLVAVLLYQLYRLIRGTAAMSIFIGIVSFYFVWRVVSSLNMELLSNILGQFIGVGVLALIVVFQQEIRRFLLILGTRYFFRNQRFALSKLLGGNVTYASKRDIEEIVDSIFKMAATKTGALIVFSSDVDFSAIIESGESLDAGVNSILLQTIFFKNSPLHDGAVVIAGNRIKAAKCVLPSSDRSDLPVQYGMRHRSAIGMTEETQAIVIVVSEQSGDVSYCVGGEIYKLSSPSELRTVIKQYNRKETDTNDS